MQLGKSFNYDLKQIISAIYKEAVKCKRNLSMLPSAKWGKDYIDQCTRLIHEWINNNQLEQVAIKLIMIIPSFLQQKLVKLQNQKMALNAQKDACSYGKTITLIFLSERCVLFKQN